MTAPQLKTWRTKSGLSQSKLATLLGVTPNTTARWERGEMAIPPFLHLALGTLERDRLEQLVTQGNVLARLPRVVRKTKKAKK